jgi:hypothetical protein
MAFPWFLKEKGSAAITSDTCKNLPPLNQTIYSQDRGFCASFGRKWEYHKIRQDGAPHGCFSSELVLNLMIAGMKDEGVRLSALFERRSFDVRLLFSNRTSLTRLDGLEAEQICERRLTSPS